MRFANPKQNLTGKVFGRLQVMALGPCAGRVVRYYCLCICGSYKLVTSYNLKKGLTKSCGCFKPHKLPPGQAKENRRIAAKEAQKTPKRLAQKRAAQRNYWKTDKAPWAVVLRWAKKKKHTVFITMSEYVEFKKNHSCTECSLPLKRSEMGFSLIDKNKGLSINNMTPECGVCRISNKKSEFNPIRHSAALLRRYWKRNPEARIAMTRAKIDYGTYSCASCKGVFKEKDTQLDHILPAVDPREGFTTLDEFANRLYCKATNLQVLCKPCHLTKTSLENQIRTEVTRVRKLKKRS